MVRRPAKIKYFSKEAYFGARVYAQGPARTEFGIKGVKRTVGVLLSKFKALK